MRGLVAILLVLLAAGAAAKDVPPMAGAGVLERNGTPDCSAVLIAPALVATAAHCIAGMRLADTGGEDEIRFRTGAYPAHPATVHDVVSIMAHPLFGVSKRLPGRGLGQDIALARLAAPVPAEVALPMAEGRPAQVGERLLVASWPGGQGQRARERICPALDASRTVARLSCVVKPGESGAPVVRLGTAGPEVAGILVATAREGNQPYGLAVQAESRILQLKAIHGE